MKKVLIIVVAIVLTVAVPMSAFAASTPYKDVTKKTVGKQAYKEMVYIYKHKGYAGVFTGKNLKPKKTIKQREFLMMLANLCDDKNVPVTMKDLRNANKPATTQWACGKMVKVANNLGVEITWNPSNKKMSRALASRYLYLFTHYDPAFKPKR